MKSGKGRERCIQITLPLGELRTGQIGTRYYDIIHRWGGTRVLRLLPHLL